MLSVSHEAMLVLPQESVLCQVVSRDNEVFLFQMKQSQELMKFVRSKNGYQLRWHHVIPGSFQSAQIFILGNGDIAINTNSHLNSTMRIFSPDVEFKKEIARPNCRMVSAFGSTLVYTMLCGNKYMLVMHDAEEDKQQMEASWFVFLKRFICLFHTIKLLD